MLNLNVHVFSTKLLKKQRLEESLMLNLNVHVFSTKLLKKQRLEESFMLNLNVQVFSTKLLKKLRSVELIMLNRNDWLIVWPKNIAVKQFGTRHFTSMKVRLVSSTAAQ